VLIGLRAPGIPRRRVPAGPSGGGRSDSLLFQSVPDLDDIRLFSQTAPKQVDVSIRAVGGFWPARSEAEQR